MSNHQRQQLQEGSVGLAVGIVIVILIVGVVVGYLKLRQQSPPQSDAKATTATQSPSDVDKAHWSALDSSYQKLHWPADYKLISTKKAGSSGAHAGYAIEYSYKAPSDVQQISNDVKRVVVQQKGQLFLKSDRSISYANVDNLMLLFTITPGQMKVTVS